MSDAVIKTVIDEKTRVEAAAVLSAMGLSLSDVIEAAIYQIAVEKRLPDGIRLNPDDRCPRRHRPNALTAATLDKSESGQGVRMAEDTQDLFRQLGLDDA